MTLQMAHLTTTLKGATRQMSDRNRATALDCFEHWRAECTRIQPEPAPNVAFTVHEIIDERIERLKATENGRKIKCQQGCAACCHLNIGIFPQEAALLHMIARAGGIEIDTARLERQAAKDDDSWHELAPEDRRCVFLSDDRECRVYEHRPGACRKYHVLSEPALCDVEKYPGGKVGIVFDVEAEIVQSAAMTVYGAGNMAAMLLKHAPAEDAT